jgi:endogenous inhibitor of DNA gyrase (YacG/DUF329 family)
MDSSINFRYSRNCCNCQFFVPDKGSNKFFGYCSIGLNYLLEERKKINLKQLAVIAKKQKWKKVNYLTVCDSHVVSHAGRIYTDLQKTDLLKNEYGI